MSSTASVCLCTSVCMYVCVYPVCVSFQCLGLSVYMCKCLYRHVLCMRGCVHLPFSVLRSVFVSLYLFHLSWHANPSVWRCEMWVVASDCEEIWAAVIFRFGIPLSLWINLRWKGSGPQTVDKATVMHDTRAQQTHAMLRQDLSNCISEML